MRILAALLLASFLAGCVGTRQEPYGATQEGPSLLTEAVQSEVAETYFAALPDCVIVLPAGSDGIAGDTPLELAVIRHARDRFSRVIGSSARRALVDRLRVDLSVPEDRAYVARRTRCAHFMEYRALSDGDVYAVVWSRKALGLDIRLVDATGESVLWRARTEAARSDGTIPLSPIGILTGAFEATRLSSDPEIPLSLADDVARRVIATLPDLGMPGSSIELGAALLAD